MCERWGEGEGFPLHCCVTGNLIASSEGGSRGERKERRNAKSSEPELLLAGSLGGGGAAGPCCGVVMVGRGHKVRKSTQAVQQERNRLDALLLHPD